MEPASEVPVVVALNKITKDRYLPTGPELAQSARERLEALGYTNVEVITGDIFFEVKENGNEGPSGSDTFPKASGFTVSQEEVCSLVMVGN